MQPKVIQGLWDPVKEVKEDPGRRKKEVHMFKHRIWLLPDVNYKDQVSMV